MHTEPCTPTDQTAVPNTFELHRIAEQWGLDVRCIKARTSCVSCARRVRSPALMPVWMRSMSMVPVVGSMAEPWSATCSRRPCLGAASRTDVLDSSMFIPPNEGSMLCALQRRGIALLTSTRDIVSEVCAQLLLKHKSPLLLQSSCPTFMRRRPSMTSSRSTVGDRRILASASASRTLLSNCRGVAVITCTHAYFHRWLWSLVRISQPLHLAR